MASFDFIDASSKGYEFAWKERKYLARVAVPVIFVKIACLLSIVVLGAENLYLRQGMISMPAFVFEGLFAVGIIRYYLYRESILVWMRPVTPPPSKTAPDPYFGQLTRKQSLHAGLAIFLLLRLFESGMSGLMLDNFQVTDTSMVDGLQVVPAPIRFLIAVGMLAGMVWSFRLLWLYIPVAMGYSVRGFLDKAAGQQTSIFMIATWVVCFLPLVVFFVSMIQLVAGALPDNSATEVIVVAVMEAVAQIIMLTVQVIAMTWGIREVLFGKNKDK